MDRFDKWAKKKVEKAQEVMGFLLGEPGVDYLWEPKNEETSPVVLIMRLPHPEKWSSRKVITNAIEFLELLGGTCQVNGDQEAATMFFTFVTVCEIALEKDEESCK